MLKTIVIAASFSFLAAMLMTRMAGADAPLSGGPIEAQAATADR